MDQEKNLSAAKSLETLFESSDLHILRNISALNTHKFEKDDETAMPDIEETENKDPAIIAMDVASQVSYLRKLKFQFLEQNAKDKYVKSIVSDIDDAPLVTDEDNKQLRLQNEERKKKLKVSKDRLAQIQGDIRTLAPLVEEDYEKVKTATSKAADLAQKIIDARLALSRLRQLHPYPRLTIQTADQKLADQVTEMQELADQIESVQNQVQTVKHRLKGGALEVESLRVQRAEAEKNVKMARVDEDDGRLVPLYDWFTVSLSLHRSMHGLENMELVSENEIRLQYRIQETKLGDHLVTIILIFVPDSRQLAAAEVAGLEDIGVDPGDVVDAHVQMNDVQGLISAVLARARAGA
ncbi:hypothetical protein Moror_14290 [Moniliophthora roreri MCA 2997]|uniref:Kinetochore protein Sos7 coiled-coil domain-containing protein n=1 Tax=Moniliophthora roreri (strain MCA 2997) TaxID=1381753 RepID=V2YSN0_MONRO|nr:hypothetical protein Moror_14290 [Moniliophthora roreri MCA 2997]